MRPELGVVIVSHNVRDLLGTCLSSLARELEVVGCTSQVVVVDNASSDGSASMVASTFPDVRVIALADNLGFAGGNNRVLDQWAAGADSCPDRVLLLNPDAVVEPGAIGALSDAMRQDRRVAVAGPRLVYPDRRQQHGAFRFPGAVQTVLDLCPIPRLADTRINGRYPAWRYAAGTPFAVDFVLGACMLVRGSAMIQIGALDSGYRMYCEEIDWCRRFRAAGYQVLCVPRAVVVHHSGASTSQQPAAMFIELWRSRLRYFRKHEPAWRVAVLSTLIRTGFAVRRAGDSLACARGRLSADERAARAAAYRAAVRPERVGP